MAAAAYEAVAGTRPRVRRDVLYTQVPEGVVFHNSDGGFQLTSKSAYRFSTLIVPHLNGENRVSDICQGLGDPQRAMVGELVQTLYDRGFARDVPEPAEPDGAAGPEPEAAERFAQQIAYIDHYADGADARFARFRGTRVAVLGEDLVARWCVLSLVRNGAAVIGVLPGLEASEHQFAEVAAEAEELAKAGCPVELLRIGTPDRGRPLDWTDLEGYDLVVVTGGVLAPQRLLPLLRAGVPEGRTLLPAWVFGERAVLGPLMTHGSTGCWACAALRLGGDDTGSAADLWSGLALSGAGATHPAAPGVRPGRPLAAMLGNLLGYEVFRLTTEALPAETRGQLILQDMRSLDVAAEPLLPHPRCPFCRTAGEPAAEPVDLGTAGLSAIPMPTLATAHESDALVEELERRSNLLVRPNAGVFSRFADEPLTQTPLKLSSLELRLGHAGPRRISAFDVHHVAGARMRVLEAAAVVYAERVAPLPGLLTGDGSAAAGERLPLITDLSTVSGTGVGAAATPAWTTATSLLSKERVLVPAAAVQSFGPYNQDRSHLPSSAGTGAGGSLPDAAARGLLSALGYDALRRAVRGSAARVPLDTLDGDAELTFLVRSAANLGVELDLLDLAEGGRSGVQVLLARSGPEWAIGSETSWQGAAVAALRDLLGRIQLGRESDVLTVDTGDPLLADLDPRTVAVVGEAPADLTGRATGWSAVLERLAAAGRDALLVRTTPADLAAAGLSTARVLLTTGAGRDH
ncbi:TOMM precursor leader peptide-binding protein [Streptacidiphilus sp. N1-12]|uniref:TOMM leader peptide-binding protein n=2 Tax=Streptacidiphilus alkalitolerans TaxID=3342712 RepID=A0ABV6WB19_9ACTN